MKIAVIFLAICGLAVAVDYKYKLDLRTPIERIRAQILVTKDKPPNWEVLPTIISKALDCLGLLIPFRVVSDRVPANIKQYIESITPISLARDLQQVDWKQVNAKGSTNQNEILTVWDSLKDFMNTTEFENIHYHIWAHEEFLDLVEFIHDANFAEIYQVIKEAYISLGRPDLAEDLPFEVSSAPEAVRRGHIRRRRSPFPQQSSSNIFPLVEQQAPIIKAECNILVDLPAIIKLISDSNLHETIKVLLYILQEVIGNSSIHILLLKLGEQHKGEFFHSTLALKEMDEFLPLVQGMVLAEPGIAQLNEILKQVTGLDIGNIDLFKYIVNLLQYLVWNYPFPSGQM